MKWSFLTLLVYLLVVLSLAHPEILASNKFLNQVISHELIAILVVILTVTMASVANIHLSLGKLRIRLLEKGVDVREDIRLARVELSDNAWYMFYAFCSVIISLVVKSHFESIYVDSFVNAFGVLVFIFNLLVLHDIYKSVYLISSLDDILYGNDSDTE